MVAHQEAVTSHISAIPSHPFLKYTHSNGALDITLDFSTPRSPFQQSELTKSLNEILPRYSKHATNISIEILFKVPHMDLINNSINAGRNFVIANTIYELNKFPQLDSVKVIVSVQKFYWEQMKPASAIYEIDYADTTFDVIENGMGPTSVEIGSTLDRRLSAHSYHEM